MRSLPIVCAAALLAALAPGADTPGPPAVDFDRDVKPIFAKHCQSCHGTEKQRGGLRLDTATAIRRGGDTGPAVVPNNGKDSLLLKAVTGHEDVAAMPPRGEKLTAKEVDAIRARYDYDLGHYAPGFLRRRLSAALGRAGIGHLGELQHRVLVEPTMFFSLLEDLSDKAAAFGYSRRAYELAPDRPNALLDFERAARASGQWALFAQALEERAKLGQERESAPLRRLVR